jgi:hypothetical protein
VTLSDEELAFLDSALPVGAAVGSRYMSILVRNLCTDTVWV